MSYIMLHHDTTKTFPDTMINFRIDDALRFRLAADQWLGHARLQCRARADPGPRWTSWGESMGANATGDSPVKHGKIYKFLKRAFLRIRHTKQYKKKCYRCYMKK